jgi:tripartite-type tricarboxylate transporter receptor subunit TctC
MKVSLAKFKVEPMTGSAQDFAKFVADEVRNWSAVVKAAGIKVE